MNNVKINLTILLPGSSLLSEQECSKKLRKPVINKKGKYAGKQARDKKGNLLWYYETVPDLDKYDRIDLKVNSKEGEEPENLVVYTRKCRDAKQVINMSEEAYNYFISSEVPYEFHAPKNFKPKFHIKPYLDKKTGKMIEGMSVKAQAWKELSIQQRLEWHLDSISASFGGRVGTYVVLED